MTSERYLSPLRYPGGKSKFGKYIKLLLKYNMLQDGDYVEPYAGGASVAIDLLFSEYVSDVHVNDVDKSIYAFWYSVLNETNELCKKIVDAKLTIDEWKKQREIYRNNHNHSLLEVGFSAFFLNRTNRSGILRGGVIGGLEQTGKWKIDARFTRENLIERIEDIADYRGRIHIYNEDAVRIVRRLSRELTPKTLFYLDPPYYVKGKELYTNHYCHQDHIDISEQLSNMNDQYWIVSYDNVAPIRDMYSKFRQTQYSLTYSAAATSKGSEVFIYSDAILVPPVDNPTDRRQIEKCALSRST